MLQAGFLFSTCQLGTEKVLKAETLRVFPAFRFAFSRPGFLTFKIPEECSGNPQVLREFLDRTVFSRTAAFSVATIVDVPNVWRILEERKIPVHRLHVFRRDPALPGDGFEPGPTVHDLAVHRMLIESCPTTQHLGIGADDLRLPAQSGETVADLVQLDDDQWFLGVHFVDEAAPLQARYANGTVPISLPSDAVSRAWLKFEEGLRWSKFPIGFGDLCADIGASPGGGSQTLLARGARVLGIDPAAINPIVLRHPNFEHVRGRIRQVKRTLFRNVRWIIVDMNVAPGYVIDVLDELLTRRDVNVRGLLFTLKLPQWELAEEIPAAVDFIKRWGFNVVTVKQLAFNRREIMVAANRGSRSTG